MMIQSLAPGFGSAMAIGQFSGANKVNGKGNEEKETKTNGQNAGGINLSQKSQFEKMTENIQKQIQAVKDSDAYDEETKQGKIEELQKQLEELNAAKTELLGESVIEKEKKAKKEAAKNSAEDTQTYTNKDGDTAELSMNMESLIKADNGIKNLEGAYSQKVKAEGSSGVLASEIKADQGRGVDTAKKEEQLAKTEASINTAFANIGEAAKSVQEAAGKIAEADKQDAEPNEENKSAEQQTIAQQA